MSQNKSKTGTLGHFADTGLTVIARKCALIAVIVAPLTLTEMTRQTVSKTTVTAKHGSNQNDH